VSWHQRFFDAIILRDRQPQVTPRDAAEYISALPEADITRLFSLPDVSETPCAALSAAGCGNVQPGRCDSPGFEQIIVVHRGSDSPNILRLTGFF
jgi:hypothetical protein